MKDKSDKHSISKDIIFDIPFRVVIVGKTGCGKTSCLGSLLLLNQFYRNDFKGKDTYIFSPLVNDFKMEQIISAKDIPDMNVFNGYDEDLLNALYDKLVEEYKKEEDELGKVSPKLVVLDDCSFDGSLRKGLFNSVSRIFCNGRKHNISIIITSQFYTHILPVCRSNISGAILYNTNRRQLELIAEDNNYLKTKKNFINEVFYENVKEKHDFIVINYSNPRSDLYLNKNFEVINTEDM